MYSLYLAAGAICEEELLSFRAFGSRLQGHPTPLLPWVDFATGTSAELLAAAGIDAAAIANAARRLALEASGESRHAA